MNQRRLARFMPHTVVVLFLVGTSACGSSNSASELFCSGACSCSGTTCACQSGGTCTLGTPASPDSGSGVDAATAPSALPPDNVTYHCDSQNQCNLSCGTGCTNTCDGQSVCGGTCTSNCTSSCAGTSQCTLTTGVNSQVTCAGGSMCGVSLDTGSTITCTGSSLCAIDCPKGGCTAECAGSSACTVHCDGTAPCNILCNGQKMQECPAGTTCSGVCGSTPLEDGGQHADAYGTDAAPGSQRDAATF